MADYNEQNDHERARLEQLLARLTDEDLARQADPDWTIAGVLGHLAFWDARALALMDRWLTRPPSVADQEPEDVDWINDASRPLAHALEPRRAAELALELARECDALVASLPAETVRANQQAGGPLNLARAEHRAEHLDKIERALRASR